MDSLINATSGGLAAICSTLALYPLDVVLVRYQTASQSKSLSGKSSKSELLDVLIDALRKGPLSLYKGVTFKMTESLIRNFVYFYVYDFLKVSYEKRFGRLTTASSLLLATLAAVLNQCITAPLEIVSTNLQTSDRTLKDIVRGVYKQHGAAGFYKGFLASMILCSNPAITNASFDRLKFAFQLFKLGQLAAQGGGGKGGELMEPPSVFDDNLPDLTAPESFVLGAVAKALATVVTYPYIRAKVLMQHASMQQPHHTHHQQHRHQPGSTGPASLQQQQQHGVGSTGELGGDHGVMRTASGIMPANAYPYRPAMPRRGQVLPSTPSLAGAPPSPSDLLTERDMAKAASFCLSDNGDACNRGHLEEDTIISLPQHYAPPQPVVPELDTDSGVMGVLVSVMMREGVAGIYKGLGLQLVKTVLAAALLYMIKEMLHIHTKRAFRRMGKLTRAIAGKPASGGAGGAGKK